MVEHLPDLELILNLFEIFLIVLALDRDDLEGVLLCVGAAADVKDGAVRALAERIDDGVFPDAFSAHGCFPNERRWQS
jgi:hypothetical protein